ncbi:DUF4349 domain-containing protein [Tundrisphaera sp. TA3]|uniref:DUF4349 domain-containing protein n=1 Tax=Tundrisphaera sp. TA3 TaxID=3435775 RepID=UPI003EBC2FAE
MRPSHLIWLAFLVIWGSGCEAKSAARRAVAESTARADAGFETPAESPIAPAAPGAADQALKAGAARKIIFTADVAVTVEDFARAEAAMTRLVAAQGGYLAESNVTGSPGAHRSGHWKARVPVDHFDAFVDGIATLGELVNRRTNSEDVSDEYFDLEARIKNKTAEEARLIRHLDVSTGKLEEILQVERELSRVREEIERMQGRKQVLANLTALTTVNITIHERQGYVPPESPTFSTRMARSFHDSADTLLACGEWLALAAAAITPWIPVILALAILLLLARNRIRATLAR